jgi:delta24-sterol reductase
MDQWDWRDEVRNKKKNRVHALTFARSLAMTSAGQPFEHVQGLRDLEAYLRTIGGYQALYATTEMTRSEWETMFHQENYRNCRKKYGAEGVFIDAYDKVKKPTKN